VEPILSGHVMTVGEAVGDGARRLREAGGSRSPRLDAELLLGKALGVTRADLLREPARALTADEAAEFEALLGRRLGREPVAYILGHRAFRTIDLEVTPAVLIPRADTETLVEVALEELTALPLAGPDPEDEPLAIDVGTGSGCVALALAAEDPFVHVVATDVDPGALAVARGNAARLGLARRVEFVVSDLFHDVGERPFDLVVSNPPYIPADEYVALEPNVRDHEPRLALYGGVAGLDFYRRLVPGAALLLRPGGMLAVEVGAGQADAVAGIMTAAGAFGRPQTRDDLGGVPRVVYTHRRGGGTV
jgi:release factor glutamine methyltransferase